MHDEIAMRELHGITDATKEPQPVDERELAGLDVLVDTNAVDTLHDEIRQAFFSGPTIEESGNPRVFELGEDLAFTPKAADKILVAQRCRDDLDRYLLVELIVSAGAKVHGPHPAPAQLALDLVSP